VKIDKAFVLFVRTFFRRNSDIKLESYQKRAKLLTQMFSFDCSLDDNRGVSVMCSIVFECFCEPWKNLF
jgi:hypothetical protein